MTGLAGFAWLMYSVVNPDDKLRFQSDSIKYQLPILIGVVLIKYFILFYNKFVTQKTLFKANIYGFILFVLVVLIIEYQANLEVFFRQFAG